MDDELYRELARRPIYESKKDVTREEKFAKHIESFSIFKVEKILKKLYPCDHALILGRDIIGLIEFKYRPDVFKYKNGVMLSLTKVSQIVSMSKVCGAPPLFCVESADDVYHAAPLDVSFKATMGGRVDRGDASDVEPVCLIPLDHFKPIRETIYDLHAKVSPDHA